MTLLLLTFVMEEMVASGWPLIALVMAVVVVDDDVVMKMLLVLEAGVSLLTFFPLLATGG